MLVYFSTVGSQQGPTTTKEVVIGPFTRSSTRWYECLVITVKLQMISSTVILLSVLGL